jgi:hypothetical protein
LLLPRLLPGRYDKVKIQLKEIINCQMAACMNPTAGSFNITPRMQRHFVTFAVQMPESDIVRSMYYSIIEGHMSTLDADVSKLAAKLVDAMCELHKNVRRPRQPLLAGAGQAHSSERACVLWQPLTGCVVLCRAW